MKLWILKSRDDLKAGDDPWDLPLGCNIELIVRADSEEQARQVAHENGRDENTAWQVSGVKTKTPWLDSAYTRCDILDQHGEPGVILIAARDG